MADLILTQESEISLAQVGGKAASLHELQEQNVPPWFVITPSAYREDLSITPEFKKALDKALTEIEGEYFAVRSSAVDEDGQGFSFAGQLESYLGISKEGVLEKVVDVWKSGFSERLKAYRKENKLGGCVPPAVIVQKMVDASSAGVAFAVDPIGGYWDRAIVSSVWGLGSALVDGAVDADTWQVGRKGEIHSSQSGEKTIGRFLQGGKEVERDVAAEKVNVFSLTEEQTVEVAQLARKCSAVRGTPQDIEWAFENGKLYLLQSRPITRLGTVADPEGIKNIWDNSNIAESYGGVTTPLTYSFARSIYAEVYREFCKLMGVPKPIIAANEQTYQGLLGLMNGRMYYNLINWYRLLAVFPGFSVNRGFMEQMMGVQQDMGDELLSLIDQPKTGKVKSFYRFTKSLFGMFWNNLTIQRQIKHFYIRLNKALQEPHIPLHQQRPDELVKSYRDLENQLLLKWDAPLVNDFFAMIFFGMLTKQSKKWCNDENGTLQNDLVGGDGQVISAEPAKRVKHMASLIADDKELAEFFRTGPVGAILKRIRQHKELHEAYNDYVEKFGDRCLDELKLESITLGDSPMPLLRAIGHFAGRKSTVSEDHAVQARKAADEEVKKALKGKFIKKFIFARVLKNARGRVRDRENLRFERTRLFGRVRRIFTELGHRFTALGVLDQPQDIFYLEKDEIISYVDGFASCTDLRGVAAVRKKKFEEYAELEPIADRFATHGMVFKGNDFSKPDGEKNEDLDAEQRQGMGCCPGVIRGKVKVVRDPRGVELPAGCILVAERTDPGWIMLFPAASGLLVERGSLLSHSAIVARELGLPAVVSIPGVTSWLNDGDEVEFDGSTGKVKLLKAANEES